MQEHTKVLQDAIQRERIGIDYIYNDVDKQLLHTMMEEMTRLLGTTVQYLAELDAFTIPGAGHIIVKYIGDFSSESIKAYLLHHLISDKVKNCDRLILDMYLKFKSSREYISSPGIPAPAHIYTRYDCAIKALKPKRLAEDLMQLVACPRDFFYLPATMKMLASWRIPEIKPSLIRYASVANIAASDVGLENNGEGYFPPFSFIKREIRFTAIDALKHYPSADVREMILGYTSDEDADVRQTAKRVMRRFDQEK